MSMRQIMVLAIALLGIAFALPGGPARAQADRHTGYYYPPITSQEDYEARVPVMAQATGEMRLGFVTGLAYQQNARPYPPPFVTFAKGETAERMIIVAVGQNGFQGLYQARAVLAHMTSMARGTPVFREKSLQEVLTFLDLIRMLGFEELTISDGQSFAHRITLR